MSQYKIEAGTGQHIGDRSEQQDRTALFVTPKAPGYMMAILADGMGGLSGGSLAAEQVIRTAQQNFDRFSPQSEKIEDMLEMIGREAHTIINLTAFSSEKQPHSTMVVLVLTPSGSAIWAHVGDSRLYRFDGPNCAEHTVDHSMVEKLVSEGKVTKEEAKGHRLSNLLVNVLGHTRGDLYVTINRYDGLKAGDSFLLCSDGLWHYFTDAELGAALAMNTPRMASEMLITKARERATGSIADNCTLAIVKLVPPPAEIKDYTAKKMRRAV
ncbi:MAG TPA: protein phosphatase 2C domain-containing protein [Burkholderiaceae bacterium]|jgi:serine/threonine protein phosphatase PrpC|nr:protein phosphatase 2C domain-containing protein [Burkholderiaceae bacterium]